MFNKFMKVWKGMPRPAVAEVKVFGFVGSIRNKYAERIAMGVADLTAVRLHKFFSCMNAEISISCSHIIYDIDYRPSSVMVECCFSHAPLVRHSYFSSWQAFGDNAKTQRKGCCSFPSLLKIMIVKDM